MNSGPRCTGGFDLALTETADGFLMEIGSASGQLVAERLSLLPATQQQQQNASAARQQATAQISRQLNSDGIHDLLMQNLRHPHWEEVASRCLSCTNCTMVCPTCFCSSVKDVSDLTGDHVSRERTWDSCFNIGFSSMNGAPVRDSISSRYRQWLTHKLATWHDQFGSSGCVGCGRCITWCPVGIDLTQEVAALRSAVEPATSRHSASDRENAEVSP
jgi:ferredoxin